MDKSLSDLEFEILDRLYHADRHTLSQTDMLKPIGSRINEYCSALTVLNNRKLIDAGSHRYHLSAFGEVKYLAECKLRESAAHEQLQQAEDRAHQLAREQMLDARYRRENKREWVGIIVSNVIAFAALVVAIISLCQ